MSHVTLRRNPVPSLLAVLSLLGVAALAGCASREDSRDGSGDSTGSEDFPVTVRAQDAPKLTLRERPDRIVSLSPTATEVLYKVGAGGQVVAADQFSTYPKKAPNKEELSALDPDPEELATFKPDVVIVNSDNDGKLTKALDKLEIKTLVLPAAPTLEKAYAQFELLGKVTGHVDAGEQLADDTQRKIEDIVDDTPTPDKKLSYYHEVSDDYYTMTSATFVGDVYDRFDLDNIADGDDPDTAGGSPQLSQEQIVSADPDMIFLADTECCNQTAGTVSERSGWDTLSAVADNNVFELDDDIASRWGPRIVKFVSAVSDAVSSTTKS